MLCSDLIKEHIKIHNLKTSDFVFDIKPPTANKYLKRIAIKIFGDVETEAGGKFSEMSLYDFRHCACCYWLLRYKSESALKYRFGWKKSDKIHYYSELLGMKDTISEEDMLVDVTKTEIEKRLMQSEKENQLLGEDNKVMKDQMQKILELVNKLQNKIEIMQHKTMPKQIEADETEIIANKEEQTLNRLEHIKSKGKFPIGASQENFGVK